MAEEQVTLGDKNVETSQFTRFKGVKDRTDRIAIISTTLVRAYRYVKQGSGGSNFAAFRAPLEPGREEILAFVKKTLGEPEQRFGLVLFHYLTDDKANLVDATKCQGSVKLWSISEARYEELSGINRRWPLMNTGFDKPQHDLEIKCSEEKFQRMQFTPCPDAHWKKQEKWFQVLTERAKKAQDKLSLAIGRKMTDQEIMDLLGGATAQQPGSTTNAGDVDLSDVLETA